MTTDVSAVLQHAKSVIDKAEEARGALPKRVLVLDDSMAKSIWAGDTKIAITANPISDSENAVYLASDTAVYGIVTLDKGKPISIAEFRRREEEHGICDDVRKSRWPRARRLYTYTITKLDAFATPVLWSYSDTITNQNTQTVTKYKRQLNADEISALSDENKECVGITYSVISSAGPVVKKVIQQMCTLSNADYSDIECVPSLLDQLREEYEAITKSLQNTEIDTKTYDNFVFAVEELVDATTSSNTFLPKRTRIYELSKLLTDTLTDFIGTYKQNLDAPETDGVSKRLPSRSAEAGIHVHHLERENQKTKQDGAHTHVFLLPSGEFLVTYEDGEHTHALDGSDANQSGSVASAHTHKVVMSDGTILETEQDGEHDHELQVMSTAFDGLHTHQLQLPDGIKVTSMMPGEFWLIAGGPEQMFNPKAPGASKLAKALTNKDE